MWEQIVDAAQMQVVYFFAHEYANSSVKGTPSWSHLVNLLDCDAVDLIATERFAAKQCAYYECPSSVSPSKGCTSGVSQSQFCSRDCWEKFLEFKRSVRAELIYADVSVAQSLKILFPNLPLDNCVNFDSQQNRIVVCEKVTEDDVPKGGPSHEVNLIPVVSISLPPYLQALNFLRCSATCRTRQLFFCKHCSVENPLLLQPVSDVLRMAASPPIVEPCDALCDCAFLECLVTVREELGRADLLLCLGKRMTSVIDDLIVDGLAPTLMDVPSPAAHDGCLIVLLVWILAITALNHEVCTAVFASKSNVTTTFAALGVDCGQLVRLLSVLFVG